MLKPKLLKLQAYSGVAGVFILWVGIGLAMHKAQLGFLDSRPISYLGEAPNTKAIFSISLLLSAALFVNFAYYVRRQFQVNNRFLRYFLIGQTGQVVAALSPYGKHDVYGYVHTVAAFVLAFSLPFLINQFTRSQTKSPHYRLYKGLLLAEQVAFIVGIGLFVFTKGLAPLGEAMPAIVFHVWIISLTYLRLRRS